jgi:hypothetical protein
LKVRESKNMSGAIFKNDTSGRPENFPGYGGSANIDGVEYWISAWVKDGQKGKFFSLSFKRKDESHAKGMQQARTALDDFDADDVPF